MLIFGLKDACNKCKPLCNSKIYTVSVQLRIVHKQHVFALPTQNAMFNCANMSGK